MSGVRTGSRLEQLQRLRSRLDLEIEQERAKAITEGGLVDHKPLIKPRTIPPNTVDAWLGQLGVTSRDVKVWAHRSGLVDSVKRGRISRRLVEAYAIAHELHEAIPA